MAIPLVQDNPFRVLGLGTQASNESLSHNYNEMIKAILAHKEIRLGQDMHHYVKSPLRTIHRLEQARHQLSSYKNRIFHGLFWFMDANKIDHAALYYLSQNNKEKAMQILQHERSYSAYINLAVMALIENRLDDALMHYTKCFESEENTKLFTQAIVGDKAYIEGVFILSKITEIINEEKQRQYEEATADERSFGGGGSGVRNLETQRRVRLVNETPNVDSLDNLFLKKQTNSFDRHLNESLQYLINRIAAINHEYGVGEGHDFVEVDLSVSSAAKLVLEEVSRFLSLNYSVMETFREHCMNAKERSMYLDYVYNLVSITHYAIHLYAIDLGRQYNQHLVQQLRSIVIKLERLYFRLKSEDIDYFISSLRRIEDCLPFIHAISITFENFYILSDDKHLVDNFYGFYEESLKILDDYNRHIAGNPDYLDCTMHLHDMIVRFNVSFMMALVNIALQKPELSAKAKAERIKAQEQEAKRLEHDINQSQEQNATQVVEHTDRNNLPIEGKVQVNIENPHEATQSFTDKNGRVMFRNPYKEPFKGALHLQNANYNNKGISAQANKGFSVPIVASDKLEKARRREAEKRSSYVKRKLSHEKARFLGILSRFESYVITKNTMTLLNVAERQVNRLPPPVSIKNLFIGILLIAGAAGAVYLNILFFNN